KRMTFGYRLQPGKTRTARHHVVFRMDLEPQTFGIAMQRIVVMLGLEAESGTGLDLHGEQAVSVGKSDQDSIGVSEPWPFGVLIDIQVPAGTFFHALPW